MQAYKLDNGNLLIPRRAEGEGGLLGDGMVEVGPDDPDYKGWVEWYAKRGEEPPPLPKHEDNADASGP